MSINVRERNDKLIKTKKELREALKLSLDNGYDILGTFYKSKHFGRHFNLENAYRFYLTVLSLDGNFYKYHFTKELYKLITGCFKQPKRLGIKYVLSWDYLVINDLKNITNFCTRIITNDLDDSIRPISEFMGRVHIGYSDDKPLETKIKQ